MFRVILIMKDNKLVIQKPLFNSEDEAQAYIDKHKKFMLAGESFQIVFDIYFAR